VELALFAGALRRGAAIRWSWLEARRRGLGRLHEPLETGLQIRRNGPPLAARIFRRLARPLWLDQEQVGLQSRVGSGR
jgi:hypothetical protein